MSVEVTELQPAAALAIKMAAVSMEGISDITTQGYARLMGYLAEQGCQIAGAPYLAYSNGNEDFSQFDIELGVPVSHPVAVRDDLFMSQTYEGKAIVTMYKGAYKDIESAYTALMEYAAEHSLEMTGVYYDYYISNPADTPESELLTQVVFPIR